MKRDSDKSRQPSQPTPRPTPTPTPRPSNPPSTPQREIRDTPKPKRVDPIEPWER